MNLGGGVGVEVRDERLQRVEAVLDVVAALLLGVQVRAPRLALRARRARRRQRLRARLPTTDLVTREPLHVSLGRRL